MKQVFVILKKELKDTLRDKRTLGFMILMPMVLMPAIIIGMFKFTEYQMQKSKEKVVKVALKNQEAAPEIAAMIQSQEKVEVVGGVTDLGQAIKDQQIDAALIFPLDFQMKLAQEQPIEIEILRHSLNDSSGNAIAKISQVTTLFNTQVLQSRFSAESVDPKILSGVSLKIEDVATGQEVGGFGLGFILPLFIVMWAIVGGQYTAIDASAGEKERKTLESLLLTPVKRLHLVVGKFLAVAVVALTSVVISLCSLYVAVRYSGLDSLMQGETQTAGIESLGIDFTLEPKVIGLMFVVSILLVLMFSAVLLSISIFAKSYKEAQSLIGPAYLVVILPISLLNSIPNFEASLAIFAIPAVNAAVLFKELLMGNFNSSHIWLTIISLIIFAAVSIVIATRIYSKESVLFRS